MSHQHNNLYRYSFVEYDVRGELVQLTSSYQRMLLGHEYPLVVQRLLGELMAATSLLTATLKFEGHIALQLQGDGPLSFITVNGGHDQTLRGVASLRSEISDQERSLRAVLGKGHLAITLTPERGERYQGIVAADADDIATILENYFEQSEQLHTRLWLHADGENAAGMMLQVMPSKGSDLLGFEHLEHLTNTITANELYTLPGEQVLARLYHQEKVELYPLQVVTFHCGCSREKTIDALTTVNPIELQQILDEDGEIVMTCEYCLAEYVFPVPLQS